MRNNGRLVAISLASFAAILMALRWQPLLIRFTQSIDDSQMLSFYLHNDYARYLSHPFEDGEVVNNSLPPEIDPTHLGPAGQFVLALNTGDCSQAGAVNETDRRTWSFLIGSCWQSKKAVERAFALWREIPGVEERFLILGQRCLETGQPDCQDSYFQAAARSLQQADWATVRLLLIYFQQTNQPEFLEIIRENLQNLDETPTGLIAYVDAYLLTTQGNYEQAFVKFDEVVAVAPLYQYVFVDAGVFALSRQDYKRARHYWQKGLELFPQYDSLYILMGNSYEKEMGFDQALTWYQHFPDDRRSLIGQGRVYSQQGDFAQALTQFEKALEKGESPEVQAMAAEAAFDLGQYEKARDLLELALKKVPQSISYHLKLAEVCHQVVDDECVFREYTTILNIDPDNITARGGIQALQDD